MAWSTDPLWQARVVNNALDDNNTDYHYLHTDHLYTPMLATDEAGGISWNAVRDAFGATAVLPGNRISMPLRLPGQYFDPERGEHYNLLRDYQPTTGRYLQTDPIGLAGGINQYGYAYANPLSYSDPTGEVPLVAVAWAYGRCVASCTAIDAAMGAMGMSCTTLGDAATDCAKDCLNPFNWFGGKKFKAAEDKGIIIPHRTQKAARRAAYRDAGIGKHGAREPVSTKKLKPGSQSPHGDPGVRTEVKSKDTKKVVHHDPYGHRQGDIPPHYGVNSPNGTVHHTYPSNHNPKNNR